LADGLIEWSVSSVGRHSGYRTEVPFQDGARGARLWQAQDVADHRCPGCGKEFVAVWQVAIGEEGGYTPVFGGPVVLYYGRCDACHEEYERTGDEPWGRRGAG
jgi:hypothetical protein